MEKKNILHENSNATHYIVIVGAFFTPVYSLLLVVGISILFDTMVGRWCAKHEALLSGKEPRLVVKSKITAKKTLNKALTYNAVVITFYLIDVAMINAPVLYWLKSEVFAFLLTKLTTLFILWLEFDSIDEKYFKVKGIRIKDKIRIFFSGIKSFIEKLFKFKKEVTSEE